MIFFLFTVSIPLLCQSQYDFPLHVGDLWEYRVEVFDREQMQISRDTLFGNGKLYFQRIPGENFYRQHGDSVFYYSPFSGFPDEYLLFDFSASPGDTITELIYPFGDTLRITCEDKSIRRKFNRDLQGWTFLVDYSTNSVDDEVIYYVLDAIGITYHSSPLGPTYDLVGARINGVRYGNISSTMSVGLRPTGFQLEQNYPNPFNPETVIPFQIEKGGNVSLNVYNIQGKLIRVLVEGYLPAGRNEITWDGTSSAGKIVESGIYFYVLTTGSSKLAKKMLLVQ